ncbi:DUF3267 domain-containing protein [Staphylococcus auricularis]|uniref:DUF3267 domain-containing protein n=1 Tax=Staphylococcus auricularis TaxID=29379 RepID=UPI00242C7F8A|nr:DUF3267 domain-containing protein [Staphylococcus auricularis]
MFLCMRQIDINARFGLPRIAFLSFATTVVTFLIGYEIMHYFSNTALTDHYFILFALEALLLYPLHKALHLIMLLPYYKSFRVFKLVKSKYIPLYNIYVNTPVNRYYFCFALVVPFIVVTGVSALMCGLFPQFGHYFIFYIALNTGISVIDCLYLKLLLFSNEGNYIEEHQTGMNILKKVSTVYDTRYE